MGGVAVESCVWRDGPAKRYFTYTADPLWELSSFSKAAKAVLQAMKRLPVPPPSQSRWGSTAPTFGRCCCRELCLSRWPCKVVFHIHRRSPVGAVELQRGCESGSSGDEEVACAAAIAASLGLDSSHIWAVLLSRVVFGAMALQSGIPHTPPIPCGSCRALARLRKRWFRR